MKTARIALLAVLAVCSITLLAAPAALAMTCAGERPPLTRFGTAFLPNITLSNFQRSNQLSNPHPGVITPRYYRARIKVDPADARDWQLTIRDETYRVLVHVNHLDFSNTGSSGHVWTSRLVGRSMLLDLRLHDGQSSTKVTVDRAFVMPERTQTPYYSWKDPANADYLGLYNYRQQGPEHWQSMRKRGDYVGLIMAVGNDRAGKAVSWCCSGIMLTKDLLLTNWHCGSPRGMPKGAFWHSSICNSATVDVSWDGDKLSQEYGCQKVEAKNEKLDYAVLRLRPTLGVGAARPTLQPMLGLSKIARSGEPLHVIHHAECKQKLVSFNCKVGTSAFRNWISADAASKTDFTHDCDTEGGSSGAPIFDAAGKLVGLHHLGYQQVGASCDNQNKAIRIEHIFDHLKAHSSALHAEVIQSITN